MMQWLTDMIIEIKEITYYGFFIEHVENKGWQIVLHEDAKILFPTLQDAQRAVRDFYNDAVPKNKGTKLKPYK